MEVQKHKQPQNLYVRRGSNIKGPFTRGIIKNFVLLGRIKVTDEVSADKQHWTPIGKHQDLIPDEMKNVKTPDDRYKLEMAIKRNDERREERRAQLDDLPNRDRRRSDRRKPEPISMVQHRNAKVALESSSVRVRNYFFQIVFLGMFLAAIGYGGYYVYVNHDTGNKNVSTCSSKPKPGVNWSNCHLLGIRLFSKDLSKSKMNNTNLKNSDLHGTNLSHSRMLYANLSNTNLSYTDFSHARLTGVNFKSADLTNAKLAHADLSFANFRDAKMGGVDLTNANLHHAIWFDGRTCAAGSIGVCR